MSVFSENWVGYLKWLGVRMVGKLDDGRAKILRPMARPPYMFFFVLFCFLGCMFDMGRN